jgi:asparagine synthase (glutamine-hydrolysing)
VSAFLGPQGPEWAKDCLSTDAIRRVGIFSPTSVDDLVAACGAGLEAGAPENQALIGVLSTQLWHHHFIENAALPVPLPVRGASVVLTEESPAYTR